MISRDWSRSRALLETIKNALLRKRPRRPSERRWYAIVAADETSHFAFEAYRRAAKRIGLNLMLVETIPLHVVLDEGYLFVGHGDSMGVFAQAATLASPASYLMSTTDAERSVCSPQVWHACESAAWLTALQRGDWMGFGDVFGYDLSNRDQRAFWSESLCELAQACLTVGTGDTASTAIKVVAEAQLGKALKSRKGDKRVSHMSAILWEGLAQGVTLGHQYGFSR